MNNDLYLLLSLVFVTLLTFFASYKGRRYSSASGIEELDIHNQKLNKWLVGLSAGVTANSGFIVTGAVGLGYLYGTTWIFLPIAWLLGDLLFWKFFPQRMNHIAQQKSSKTLIDLLTSSFTPESKKIISTLVGIIVVLSMSAYLSTQFLAGEKFISTSLSGFSNAEALLIFTGVVALYSLLGGFRGSVYADAFHAAIGFIGTTAAFVTISLHAVNLGPEFSSVISENGSSFLIPFSGYSTLSIIGFFLGFSAAALGFGLGQPQVVSRYIAGKSPQEINRSKWVYIFFIQYTWILMTAFGVILKGVIPEIEDPEAGLITYFIDNSNGIVAGLIISTIFVIIASTANSIGISTGHIIVNDTLQVKNKTNTAVNLSVGFVFMISLLIAHFFKDYGIFNLAVTAVSFLGASIGAAMIILLFDWKRTVNSTLTTIFIGAISAYLWKESGQSVLLNEAFIGILSGLVSNYIVVRLWDQK